jgi:hypothetical protein
VRALAGLFDRHVVRRIVVHNTLPEQHGVFRMPAESRPPCGQDFEPGPATAVPVCTQE